MEKVDHLLRSLADYFAHLEAINIRTELVYLNEQDYSLLKTSDQHLDGHLWGAEILSGFLCPEIAAGSCAVQGSTRSRVTEQRLQMKLSGPLNLAYLTYDDPPINIDL